MGSEDRGVNVTSVPNVAVGAVHQLRCEFMGGSVDGWVPDKLSAPH